jgi:threonine dehydrogenase-like Zn-dependent dehydrogenase
VRGAVLYGPGDVRLDERADPEIIEPGDAVIRLTASCVCGSDLWLYRGITPVDGPAPIGHEYCGVVEEVGGDVQAIKPGQFVIGSFVASDNTCPNCQAGYQTTCLHRQPVRGAQGVDRVKDLTGGVGADAVLECVGTGESMKQAIRSARPGAMVGFVGVPHDVSISGEDLFRTHVGVRGGPAPVRRFLPELIDLVWRGEIDPGQVFDLTLPLDQVAEGYRAMDERRAIKSLLMP